MSDTQIDHEEAVHKANFRREYSNLARCYLDLQAQLAQAREQLEYSNALEAQHDIIVADLNAQIDKMRERLAGAMEFVPIAEAGLQDGDDVDIWSIKNHWTRGEYSSEFEGFWIAYQGRKALYSKNYVTHILCIKPPKAEPEL